MADTHNHEAHHGPSVKTYLVIFGALSIFTAISFVANGMAHAEKISHMTSFAIILSVAVVKATLVAMYFMHLVIDWGKLYYLIIPVLILATLAIVVLLPDAVLSKLRIN